MSHETDQNKDSGIKQGIWRTVNVILDMIYDKTKEKMVFTGSQNYITIFAMMPHHCLDRICGPMAATSFPFCLTAFHQKIYANSSNSASSMPADAQAAVRNFLASLQQGGMPSGSNQQSAEGKLYPLLNDLLGSSTTIPMIQAADEAYIDNLLSFLPPVVLVLAQQGIDSSGDAIEKEPSSDSTAAAVASMSMVQKRALLEKVLRSPQFHQSLGSLSMALRDGGLPSIVGALGVKVENGGFVRGGAMPLGGGDAIEAFVEGVKKTVQEEKK